MTPERYLSAPMRSPRRPGIASSSQDRRGMRDLRRDAGPIRGNGTRMGHAAKAVTDPWMNADGDQAEGPTSQTPVPMIFQGGMQKPNWRQVHDRHPDGRRVRPVPDDPAMAAPDPAMFSPMTTGENTILNAHLTSGWRQAGRRLPAFLSEPWRETGALIDDLSGAWWESRRGKRGEPEAGA